MINDQKPYELNEQEINEVSAGFMEPAPSDEEMIQRLWGTGVTVEAGRPGAFVHDDSASGSW